MTTSDSDQLTRTAAATAARRENTAAALRRVEDALARMRREKISITVAGVARRAAVSRTFLYDNPSAQHVIATARAATAADHQAAGIRRQADADASWRERALNAEAMLKTAHEEIRQQRTTIGTLMGQLRDLETEWTDHSIQRITTENTTLKQRLHQLTREHHELDERLTAARSNLRFQDRRIADLEMQLITHTVAGAVESGPTAFDAPAPSEK